MDQDNSIFSENYTIFSILKNQKIPYYLVTNDLRNNPIYQHL